MATVDFKIKNLKAADGTSATLAEVHGSIDATSIGQFQNVMDKLVEKGVKNLILDCANVKYINSTGLGTLLKYVDTFDGAGGHMAFVRVPSKVMLVMEMLGFNALFSISADEGAALKSFVPEQPEPASPPVPAVPSPVPAVLTPAPALRTPIPVAASPLPVIPSVSFPLKVDCTRCQVTLEIQDPGKFRCPRCSTILAVEPTGRVRFFASKKIKPIQLVLPTDERIVGGVGQLVVNAAQQAGFNGQSMNALSNAVTEACRNFIQVAYGQDTSSIFHMIIIPENGQLTVRISDHGQTFQFEGGSLQSDPRFASAVKEMDLVAHTSGQRGGNIITMTKRVG